MESRIDYTDVQSSMIRSPKISFRLLTGILLAGGVIIGSAISGCARKPKAEEADAEPAPAVVDVFVIKNSTIHDQIGLDGTFAVPEGKYAKLAALGPGRLAKVFVKEGDHVSAGQILAIVDLGVQNAQLDSARAASISAKASAAQTQLSYQAAESDNKNAVESARLSLESAIADRKSTVTQAEIDLTRLKSGARPQELATSEQAVHQAKVTRDRTKTDFDRDAKLFEKGYIAGSQLDNSKAAYDVAESALKQAELQYELLKVGARKEDIDAAEEKLRSAKELGDKKVAIAETALALAKQGLLAVKAKAKESVAANFTATQKAADAVAADQSVRNGEIRAPWSGTVVRRLMNPGDVADTTTTILELATADAQVDFVGNVASSEAESFQVGQSVTFPKLGSLNGTVKSIGVASGLTGLIPIRVHCSAIGALTRAGTFATASILIKDLKAVPVVPESAILTRDDKTVVFAVRDGTAKQIEVQTGPKENGFVAITKGIAAGQTVILLGHHELSVGAKVEPAKK